MQIVAPNCIIVEPPIRLRMSYRCHTSQLVGPTILVWTIMQMTCLPLQCSCSIVRFRPRDFDLVCPGKRWAHVAPTNERLEPLRLPRASKDELMLRALLLAQPKLHMSTAHEANK